MKRHDVDEPLIKIASNDGMKENLREPITICGPPVVYPYRDDHLVGIHTKTRMVVADSPDLSVCGKQAPPHPISV